VTATVADPERALRVRSGRHDRIGLAAVVVGGGLLVLLSAGMVSGPLAVVAVALLVVTIVGYVVAVVSGGPEARRRLAPYGLLQPGVFFLALFYLAPLFTLLRTSLSTLPSRFAVEPVFDWNWSNYADALTDFGPQFQRGFTYAAAATVLCIIIGYPLAYVIAFRGGRWKNLLLGLVVIPFFTSYLIRTIAWQSLLADQGPIIGLLERLRLTGPLEDIGIMENGRLLDTASAVIGGLTYNFIPFMVLPIYVSLEKINPALVDAAKDLYSSSTRAFRKVVVPLSLPGVFAGTLLTFIPAAGDFINAEYLGTPNTTMIGNSIQNQFLEQNNYPLAAAMSFVLMAVIVIATLVYTKFMGTEDIA
jgi:spermidine/putrescine transport system permease protein